MSHDSKQYLLDVYLGELGGESSFLAMIAHLPEHEEKLRLLATVEKETAAALAPYLEEKPSASTVADVHNAATERMKTFQLDSWSAMIDGVLPIVDAALAQIIEAEQHAPEALRDIYRTYTAHEQALADCLRLEKEGKDGSGALTQYLATLATD